MIGGADGIAPMLRDRADFKLSFGKMVWPHMLVRVMLAEQLYRAASIWRERPIIGRDLTEWLRHALLV